MSHNRRVSRVAQAVSVGLCLFMVRSGIGSPGDAFVTPAPILGGDPPEARELGIGDASVSGKTGAFQYAYPIAVPPGRGGVQPQLAVSYSSQGAIYGGVAAGWSLDLPEITLDGSRSRLGDTYFANDLDLHFVSSMAGGRSLVAVAETTDSDVIGAYRAQHDDGYARYERLSSSVAGAMWRARTPDGTLYVFGDADHMHGEYDWRRSPLTRMSDAFGNTVDYYWDPVEVGGDVVDYTLASIHYTSNPAAGLAAFAKVELEYAPVVTCPGTTTPKGAAVDYRSGVLEMRGARKLTQIRTSAIDPVTNSYRVVRSVRLDYDTAAESCTAKHGPMRLLTSIAETGYAIDGTATEMPPVTFGYGELERRLDTPVAFDFNPPDQAIEAAISWGWGRDVLGTGWTNGQTIRN